MNNRYILALDQGTTSSKAIILDKNASMIAVSKNFPIPVNSPKPGWVEYDPNCMLESLVEAARDVIHVSGINPAEIAVAGLANQGETIIAFNKEDGTPICSAISWQDRRTVGQVNQWKEQGLGQMVMEKTGLKLDPYFSASKMRWVLDNVDQAVELLAKDQLCLATSDAWLTFQLTHGSRFITDRSTASRTMLLNLKTLQWDKKILDEFEIPAATLPALVDNTSVVGDIHESWLGCPIPMGGLCVDQQAALFGQQCFKPGEAKLTYGTGCFMLANVGTDEALRSKDLLTSVGWQMNNETQYAFDGGIYTAGSMIDWMVSKLGLADASHELDQLLDSKKELGNLFFIPALSGLAAPYWEPDVQGSWFGLTLSHDRKCLLQSGVEAIAFRVKDIFDLMESDGIKLETLKVDGGLTKSRFLMQYQADLLGIPIVVNDSAEATSYGIGLFAGFAIGLFSPTSDELKTKSIQTVYQPNGQTGQKYKKRYQQWRKIIEEVISWQKRGILTST